LLLVGRGTKLAIRGEELERATSPIAISWLCFGRDREVTLGRGHRCIGNTLADLLEETIITGTGQALLKGSGSVSPKARHCYVLRSRT
jgi:hypothetical protein